MQKNRIVVDKLLKKMINRTVQQEIDKWPPDCPFIAFQPERPYRNCEKTKQKNKIKTT